MLLQTHKQNALGTKGRKEEAAAVGEVLIIWSWRRTCLARSPWRQEDVLPQDTEGIRCTSAPLKM